MNRPARKPAEPLALQDAKARFSEVVAAAMRGQPQHVTRRGKPAVVIVGIAEFERLTARGQAKPISFIEHLIGQPKTPSGMLTPRLPPLRVAPRDIDLTP